jgi:DNA-binding NarL/FixJ family response regulator
MFFFSRVALLYVFRTNRDLVPACTIKIALVEDHKLVREGLKAILKSEPTFELVAEASDGLQAVEIVEKQRPDVLLLDLRIPRLHGIEVLRQVRDQTRTRVVVVSMHSDEPYVVESLKNGVSGYVLKDCNPAELIEAIRVAAAGGQYLCEALRQKAVSATLKRLVPGVQSPQLSKRELLVLELAAEGKTSREVAEALFISRRTAEAHRANLMKKLGLKTQTDLVLYAIRNGLITA